MYKSSSTLKPNKPDNNIRYFTLMLLGCFIQYLYVVVFTPIALHTSLTVYKCFRGKNNKGCNSLLANLLNDLFSFIYAYYQLFTSFIGGGNSTK